MLQNVSLASSRHLGYETEATAELRLYAKSEPRPVLIVDDLVNIMVDEKQREARCKREFSKSAVNDYVVNSLVIGTEPFGHRLNALPLSRLGRSNVARKMSMRTWDNKILS